MSQQLFTMYSSTSTRGTLQGKESSLGFPKALLHICEPPKTIQVCVRVCVRCSSCTLHRSGFNLSNEFTYVKILETKY